MGKPPHLGLGAPHEQPHIVPSSPALRREWSSARRRGPCRILLHASLSPLPRLPPPPQRRPPPRRRRDRGSGSPTAPHLSPAAVGIVTPGYQVFTTLAAIRCSSPVVRPASVPAPPATGNSVPAVPPVQRGCCRARVRGACLGCGRVRNACARAAWHGGISHEPRSVPRRRQRHSESDRLPCGVRRRHVAGLNA